MRRRTSRPATAGPSWRPCRRAWARSTSSTWSRIGTARWSCARCSTGWSSYRLRSVPGVIEVNTMGGRGQAVPGRARPAEDGRVQADAARGADRPAAEQHQRRRRLHREATTSRSSSAARRSSRTPRTSPTRCCRSTRTARRRCCGGWPRCVSAPALRYGVVTMHGKGEIVAGTVMMLIGENSRDVVKDVKVKLEEIKRGAPRPASRSRRTTTAPTSSSGC